MNNCSSDTTLWKTTSKSNLVGKNTLLLGHSWDGMLILKEKKEDALLLIFGIDFNRKLLINNRSYYF